MKKVMFVESGPGFGGSIFSLYRLAKNLDCHRYSPFIVAYSEVPIIEKFRALGLPVLILKPVRIFPPSLGNSSNSLLNNLVFYSNLLYEVLINGLLLARAIRREKIDIVHLNNGIIDNLAALMAARLSKIPCVTHVRGSEKLTRLEKKLSGWVDAVITLNPMMLDHYRNDFDRVSMVSNGVDLDSFKHFETLELRNKLDIKPGEFAVGTAARLVTGKGIPEFIQAASIIISQQKNVRFFVIGDDTSPGALYEKSLKQIVDDLGLANYISFIGWHDNIFDLMAAMDIMIQVSTTFPEGMSLAPMEAMALGKPVIVSDNPGYTCTVDDGLNGFVVPAGDVTNLANKIQTLLSNEGLLHRLGGKAREKAVKEFDVKITARKVQDIYDEIIS